MISARKALELVARRQSALRGRAPARCAASARRGATSSRSGKSRSRSCSAAPTRACRPRSCSIKASAICSSSASPATSSRRRRSAASSSRPSNSTRGSSSCSATRVAARFIATIEQLKRPVEKQSRNLRAIVDRVRPSVEPLLATALRDDPQALVRNAVRANVRASASNLRHGSEILEQLIDARRAARRRRRVLARDRRRRVLRRAAASVSCGERHAALVLQSSIVVDGASSMHA